MEDMEEKMARRFEEKQDVIPIKIEKVDRLPGYGKRGAVAVGRLGSY